MDGPVVPLQLRVQGERIVGSGDHWCARSGGANAHEDAAPGFAPQGTGESRMVSTMTGCQIPRVHDPRPHAAARRAFRLACAGAFLGASACAGPPVDPDDRPATHQYTVEYDSVRMRDGVWLGITRWVPVAMKERERFPVLLEMIPYRKDDDFYSRDFPLYDWFARRGFLMAKVDVRGTGASTGPVPSREYSEAELDDAVELIGLLAADPRANGRVGMWGISWGGFNAIQVAMRQPPALRAILAMHASDDLFHDDVRYIDGVLHFDRYALQIDHGNGLPRTPRYALDSAYFADRFEARPWLLTYLAEQEDGEFWRRNALRWRRAALQVPAYFIGGLLDGYRDTPLRALAQQVAAPVKVEIGPWNHSWPDNGAPGPNYEWRVRAARWWDHWLNDRDTGLMDEPPLLVFQREAPAPDAARETTPGAWRFEEWPVRGASVVTAPLGADTARTLAYAPGSGTAAGEWWGEPTGDMAADDARAITIDLPAADTAITILGLPRVTVVVREGAPLAHWVARLESVWPDGRSSLITGGAVNVAHRYGTDAPQRAEPGAVDSLTIDLHFTTWTLPPGHRLRVALTNAQFPMLWPTPYATAGVVDLSRSRLELPVVPRASAYPAPVLPVPHPRRGREDVTAIADTSVGPLVTHDSAAGATVVRWLTVNARRQGEARFSAREEYRYEVRDADPAGATFEGFAMHQIDVDRTIVVETRFRVRGTEEHFDVTVSRRLTMNGRMLREKEWVERIPRRWH